MKLGYAYRIENVGTLTFHADFRDEDGIEQYSKELGKLLDVMKRINGDYLTIRSVLTDLSTHFIDCIRERAYNRDFVDTVLEFRVRFALDMTNEHLKRVTYELGKKVAKKADQKITLAVGNKAYVECTSGIGSGGIKTVTAITVGYDSVKLEKYDVIHFGKRRFDSRTLMAMNSPFSYEIQGKR